jgi:DNA (cytosine-5)-methyltransferase 1
MIRLATLFSGVGTPEQSLQHLQIEHETVFACEIDKYARQTYLANNQEPKTFYDDVYNIDGNKYKNQIDILIGGSPCQSFSIAGKRMGTSCPRGNLIYEYFRIVEEVKPKVFIYENVKGFLSIDKIDKKEKYGETFKNFVQSFKELGYTIYYEILNTKDYGVPQNQSSKNR